MRKSCLRSPASTGRTECIVSGRTASLELKLKHTSREQMLAYEEAWTQVWLSLLTVPSCCSHSTTILTLQYLSSAYHLVTCPLPGTSEAGSAGSGCGWYGRSGSSSGGGRSRLHCSADSSWRSPAWEMGMENTLGYWMKRRGWKMFRDWRSFHIFIVFQCWQNSLLAMVEIDSNLL